MTDALEPTPEAPVTEVRSRPPWGVTDLLLVVASFFVATFVTGLLAYAAMRSTPHFRGMTSKAAFKDPLLLVPMEFGSYLLAFLFTRMWITLRAMEDFWVAIQWRWPGGVAALALMSTGALMAFVLQAASYYLPIPKGLPMERYFHEPAFAWLMLVFGVAVAPMVEELFLSPRASVSGDGAMGKDLCRHLHRVFVCAAASGAACACVGAAGGAVRGGAGVDHHTRQ